ncbi:MSMEG_6728 family protein [Gordonia amicalis]|uniref:MSMEG_6728 family protein n=1 Tax=Gordonia amicalis TaxID=89053 RepID=UPI0022B435B5|nr:MSMEG_6728 family protein [Gordonia amicalis]MCZ4650114.1 MSMEG_6728 family protein [Gordonia amicalis]
MQTFLPYPDFRRSAEALDPARLGKQRVETLQILRALELYDYGWGNHPAVTMWRGHTAALVSYGLAFVDVWLRGGRADTTAAMIAEFAPEAVGVSQSDLADAGLMPPWLGDDRLHRSHRSALLRKDPDFYVGEFGNVPDDLPYFWPGPPATVPDPDDRGRTVWIIRASSTEQYDEFRRRDIVGLGAESGIDADAAMATADGLRALLKECSPGRRPGKDLRVLASFVDDLTPGDEVAVVDPGDPEILRLGEIEGDYEFTRRGKTLAPHRRRVRWTGTLARASVLPPALLQNPRTMFPVPVETAWPDGIGKRGPCG